MTTEFRYLGWNEYHRISKFLDKHWAKEHVYVRSSQLFDWTFGRSDLWDQEGYSFAVAEHKGKIVGILGAIPFVFNCLGKMSLGVWFANYMVHSDHRRGPTAIRLLNMFRRPPFDAVVAFGINPSVVPLYRALRAQILTDMPRQFAVLPNAVARMTNLLRIAYPHYGRPRCESLARAFRLTDFSDAPVNSASSIPPNWNDAVWPQLAATSIGAARDLDYLTWRYLEHPCFNYRFITISERGHTGLAVWRLETIRCVTPQGTQEVDRIGRLVEFLPASRDNARKLLSVFWHKLYEANAIGADYYGYHGEIGRWLNECGFHTVKDHPDGDAIPSRFQPLEAKGGRILSATLVPKGVPSCSSDPHCKWYWTKSDADQDRPN